MKNDKQIYQQLAFSTHTSTAFIIESPFHLLCALEAIAEFEICDYKIVLCIERGNIRNEQTFAMLRDRKMDSDVYYVDELQNNSEFSKKGNYDRIMIGDYDDLTLLKLVEKYASEHAEVVFMDDGLSSVQILKGMPYQHTPFVARLRHLLKGDIGIERTRKSIFKHWKTIGISNNFCMYTIYNDIKSKKFAIYPNRLSHLVIEKGKGPDVVLIVGTVINECAEEEYKIPVALFEGLLWAKLVEVREKYPDTKILYIPHGRDKNQHIEQLCKCLDIEYKRLQMSIEYFVISENLNVIAIYGTLSTALFTLRKIAKVPVTHWRISHKHKSYKREFLHDQCAKYYEQMGIKTEYINIPDVMKS